MNGLCDVRVLLHVLKWAHAENFENKTAPSILAGQARERQVYKKFSKRTVTSLDSESLIV